MTVAAARILCISRTVSDLSRAAAFYCGGLGFAAGDEMLLDDPGLFRLLGLAHASARALILTLGGQQIELVAFDPPGRPYPPGSDAASPWFQHCAIVVRDMDAAYDRLRAQGGFTPISWGGPQTLPPTSGAVTAFKFRDPDGHPLELIRFPPGTGPQAWRDPLGGALWLGVDHTAIVVQDQARSIDFYTRRLGLSVAGRSRNAGPEQQRLDGLARDIAGVIALEPAEQATPHLELLAYQVPHPNPDATAASAADDMAATRLVLEVDDLASLESVLRRGGVAFVSPGIVRLQGGARAALIRDPDGHAVLLVDRS